MRRLEAEDSSRLAAVQRAVNDLRAAWDRGAQIAPLVGLDLAGAYEVQHRLVDECLAEGCGLAGFKVGLTSSSARDSLEATVPDYGHLFDHMIVTGPIVDSKPLRQPRAEVEIAFTLGADLEGPHVDEEGARAAVAFVAPAIEFVDTRIADWQITLTDTVADNGSAAVAVVGKLTEFGENSGDLAEVEGTLSVDGSVVATGVGSTVYGHPLRSLAWLANALAERGETLRAGHVVLAGSLVAPYSVGPTSTVVADLGWLGRVEARLRPDET